MTFPRITAAVFVLLFIGCFALIGVESVVLVGPTLTHSTQAAHDAGTIKQINADMSFTLMTADGKLVRFQCSASCKTALGHMMRHRNENAHTDVYYVAEANDTFLALDVD